MTGDTREFSGSPTMKEVFEDELRRGGAAIL